jgi:hypothetical protein
MGEINNSLPVKYFAAITFTDAKFLDKVMKELEDTFSAVEMKSDIYNFSQFTNYYRKEMGDNLKKLFIVFSDLESPEQLADKKILSNKMEDKYVVKGKRAINIDPGYITEAKVVLATTKNYSHRIYLKSGIYGDVHLCFVSKSFQKQAWTYPDYQQTKIIDFFNQVRKIYFTQLGGAGFKPAST